MHHPQDLSRVRAPHRAVPRLRYRLKFCFPFSELRFKISASQARHLGELLPAGGRRRLARGPSPGLVLLEVWFLQEITMKTMLMILALAGTAAAEAGEDKTPHAADDSRCPLRVGTFEDVAPVSKADDLGRVSAAASKSVKAAASIEQRPHCGLRADGTSTRPCAAGTHRLPCAIDEDGNRIACSTGDDAFVGLSASRPAPHCSLSKPTANLRPNLEATTRPGAPTTSSDEKLAPEAL